MKAIFITSIAIMSSLISYLYDKKIKDNYLVAVALLINFVIIVLLFKKIIKERFIEGVIMNAFEIGLSIGMIALIYITYEILKYEPLDEK